MSQLDGFFADAARIGDDIRAAKARADDAVRATKVIDFLKEANAGNLAMKHLLLRELKRVDPNHPLVLGAALRERISAEAEKVMKRTDNWDDVRDFGLKFAIPKR
jgi:hypothetical protein